MNRLPERHQRHRLPHRYTLHRAQNSVRMNHKRCPQQFHSHLTCYLIVWRNIILRACPRTSTHRNISDFPRAHTRYVPHINRSHTHMTMSPLNRPVSFVRAQYWRAVCSATIAAAYTAQARCADIWDTFSVDRRNASARRARRGWRHSSIICSSVSVGSVE